MADWIMSPQARRRLLRTMTLSELGDLAREIERDLLAEGYEIRTDRNDADPQRVIVRTLTREAS